MIVKTIADGDTIAFLAENVLDTIEVMEALCCLIGAAAKTDQCMFNGIQMDVKAIPKVAGFMAEQLKEAGDALKHVIDGEPIRMSEDNEDLDVQERV